MLLIETLRKLLAHQRPEAAALVLLHLIEKAVECVARAQDGVAHALAEAGKGRGGLGEMLAEDELRLEPRELTEPVEDLSAMGSGEGGSVR